MIYLDNGATTRIDPVVIQVMTDVMHQQFANPSSLHRLGGEAEKLIRRARDIIAQSLAVLPGEIYFTSGGTEANNLAIQGAAAFYKQRGKHLITTKVEHPSVYDVFQSLEEEGWHVTYLPVNSFGRVNVADVKQALTDETVLVSIMHVNNETGTIQPIQQIGHMLKMNKKILFHVDAVQSYGKLPLFPKKWGIDLLSISGHKIHGPKGIGVLYVRQGRKITPLFWGGGQENRLRPGTENVPAIAGLAKAVMIATEQQKKRAQMQEWKNHFLKAMKQRLPDVKINGDQSAEGGTPYIMNLSFSGLKSEVIVHALEAEKCYVSSRSACSSKLEIPSRVLMSIGLTEQEALGSIRVSMGYDTKAEDLDQLKEAIFHVIPKLQQIKV